MDRTTWDHHRVSIASEQPLLWWTFNEINLLIRQIDSTNAARPVDQHWVRLAEVWAENGNNEQCKANHTMKPLSKSAINELIAMPQGAHVNSRGWREKKWLDSNTPEVDFYFAKLKTNKVFSVEDPTRAWLGEIFSSPFCIIIIWLCDNSWNHRDRKISIRTALAQLRPARHASDVGSG